MIVARGLGRGAVAGALVAFGLGLSEQVQPPVDDTPAYVAGGLSPFLQEQIREAARRVAADRRRRQREDDELLALLL